MQNDQSPRQFRVFIEIDWSLKDLKDHTRWHRGLLGRGEARAKRYYKRQLNRQRRRALKKIESD